MKQDKKAVLFLVVLIIATLGVVGLIGVQGWKYLNDGVLEDWQEEYEEYLVQKEEESTRLNAKQLIFFVLEILQLLKIHANII